MLFFLPEIGDVLAEKMLESETIQNFLRSDRKFDLIISENFVVESVWSGMAHKYKASLIIIAPFAPNYWANFMVCLAVLECFALDVESFGISRWATLHRLRISRTRFSACLPP